MVAEISYDTVSNVVDSWELLRHMDNYQERVGVELFRVFFQLEPEAAKVFSFGQCIDVTADDFYRSPRLVKHAAHYMRMLDRAINLLGPDIEMLTEIMLTLGEQHDKFGVRPSFYPPMGQALLVVLEEFLGEDFTPHMKECWLETYQALSYDMMRSVKSQPK